MKLRPAAFNDPSDFPVASCGPCYPRDAPEDVFLDCLESLAKSEKSYLNEFRDFAVRTFRRFWTEWQQIEEVPSHASGEEGAIALLHTLTDSPNREEALRAYCYLLAIGRTPLTQTDVAHLFWDDKGMPSTPGVERSRSYTPKELAKKNERRATVNSRVIAIRTELKLGQVAGMKNDNARKVYVDRANRVHQKRIDQVNKWKQLNQAPSLFQQAMLLNQ